MTGAPSGPPVHTAPAVRPALAVPEFLVRELHGTLSWSVLIAVVMILVFGQTLLALCQNLVIVSDPAGSGWTTEAAVLVSCYTVVLAISGWTAIRMLKYLAAIWRLRANSPMEAGEDVLRRQHQLWIAMTAVALHGAIVLSLAMSAEILHAREQAATMKSMLAERENDRRLMDEMERQWVERKEKDAEEANAERERKMRVKKLEEEYWRSKGGKPE